MRCWAGGALHDPRGTSCPIPIPAFEAGFVLEKTCYSRIVRGRLSGKLLGSLGLYHCGNSRTGYEYQRDGLNDPKRDLYVVARRHDKKLARMANGRATAGSKSEPMGQLCRYLTKNGVRGLTGSHLCFFSCWAAISWVAQLHIFR
jgi:hypothetical protein